MIIIFFENYDVSKFIINFKIYHKFVIVHHKFQKHNIQQKRGHIFEIYGCDIYDFEFKMNNLVTRNSKNTDTN